MKRWQRLTLLWIGYAVFLLPRLIQPDNEALAMIALVTGFALFLMSVYKLVE